MIRALKAVGLVAVTMSSFTLASEQQQTLEASFTTDQYIQTWVSDVPLDQIFPNNKFEGMEVLIDDTVKPEGEPNSDNTINRFDNPFSDVEMHDIMQEEMKHLMPKVMDVDVEPPKEEEEEENQEEGGEEKDPNEQEEEGEKRRSLNVFMPNQRQPSNVFGFPGRIVGLIIMPLGTCTGELVGASHTLVTNAHCVDNNNIQNWFQNARVLLGFQSLNGVWTSTGIGWFRQVTTVTNSYDGLDYAVIHVMPANDGLQSGNIWPMGNFFGISIPADDALEDNPFIVNQYAYSGDQISNFGNIVGQGTVAQRMHLSCSTHGEAFFGSDILHDCDCKKGSSGSVLINNANQVLALNHAQRYGSDAQRASQEYPSYKDSWANLANNIEDVYSWIRAYNAIPPFTLSPTAFPTKRPTTPTARPTSTAKPTKAMTMRRFTKSPTPKFTEKRVNSTPTKKFTEKFLG